MKLTVTQSTTRSGVHVLRFDNGDTATYNIETDQLSVSFRPSKHTEQYLITVLETVERIKARTGHLV
jgi:hypothetical protein